MNVSSGSTTSTNGHWPIRVRVRVSFLVICCYCYCCCCCYCCCWILISVPSAHCWSAFRTQFVSRQWPQQRSLPPGNHRSPFGSLSRVRFVPATQLFAKEKEDEDEEEDEEEDDEPPEVDIRNFKYPSGADNASGTGGASSFGLGRGRSSPSQRKAMGTSSKTSTTVYVCSNCGGESVQWRGRCPTCKEWNTFREVAVQRSSSSSGSGTVGGPSQNLFRGLKARPRRKPSTSRSDSVSDSEFGYDTDTDYDYDYDYDSGRSSSTRDFLGGQSWLDGISAGGGSGGGFTYDNPSSRPVSIADVDLDAPESARLKIPNDDEMNEVLGGGLMKGSLILLGGDPGVGKSTLALQMAARVANLSTPPAGIGMGPSPSRSASDEAVGPVWYVSGEETLEQIATRAQRLVASSSSSNNNDDDDDDDDEIDSGWTSSLADQSRMEALPKQLFLLSETNLNVFADGVIRAWIDGNHNHDPSSFAGEEDRGSSLAAAAAAAAAPRGNLPPSLIVIDSIQTMVCEAGGSSSAGGISQVRESMALLLRLAKTTQIPIVTIGHVTKTGDVAGPRMVEHMVDAVLYLEHSQSSASSASQGNGNGNFRWLRAQKNRFGSCQTAGLYDFREGILVPLPEGTESSLAPPAEDLEGCAMGICVEGPHRAMTVEVQALVAVPSGSFGRKTVEGGLSSARLNLLLGILQKHCQLPIAGSGKMGRDIYVNVVGCDGAVSKSQLALATMSLDLAVTVALTSSYLRIPVRGDTAFLAQVGLLGELRSLSSLESRLLQAQRMGFSRVVVASTKSPASSRNNKFQRTNRSKNKIKNKNKNKASSGSGGTDGESEVRRTRKHDLDIYECSNLKEALNLALVSPIPAARRRSPRQKKSEDGSSTSLADKKFGKRGFPPGSIRELNLDEHDNNNVILDDEDDEDDDYGLW